MELFKLFGTVMVDTDKANTSLSKIDKKSSDTGNSIGKTFKNMAKIVASAFTVKEIVQFGQDCIAAYNVQKEAETKLETVMRQRMKSTDEGIQSIKNYVSELQTIGVVGDEVALAGAQQVATFLNEEESLKALLPAMENLAVQQKGVNVSQGDMINIGNMMGKVMTGQVGALSRVGISFTEAQEKVLKYGTEQERASMLAQVITENVGNMNEVIAQTPEGRATQLANEMGDLKEVIGGKLLPFQNLWNEVLIKGMKFISETAIPKLGEFMNWYTNIGQEIDKVNKFIKEHETELTILGGIIGTITGLLIAYKVQTSLGTAMLWLHTTATTVATTATTAFNTAIAFLTSPIGLAVVAIGSLITIGTLLYKNWDTVKEFAVKSWNQIKEGITTPMNKAKGFVKGVVDSIKGFFKFKITWPKIPMPKFAIKPNGWKIGDLLKGSIPKLDIDWHAKAMHNPIALQGATIFGQNNGKLLGGGEAGTEYISGKEGIQKAVAEVLDRMDWEIKLDGREVGRLVRKYA